MRANKLLQTIISKSCHFMHSTRKEALLAITCSLLRGKKLTMTELGNNLSMKSHTSERHCIKRVSNFLSNKHIHRENTAIQKCNAQWLLNGLRKVEIIVDWTPANTHKYNVLRANLIHKNSSITLYQELHPESRSNNPAIEIHFLNKLKSIIPDTVVNVLIITDAGFYCRWFEAILLLGWNFIGRVRSTTQVKLGADSGWEKATSIAKRASNRPKDLGSCLLTKKHQLNVRAYCYKQRLKPTHKKSSRHAPRQSHNTRRSIASYTEGWFIVTNLAKVSIKNSKTIIRHYQDRMKIEASNRSTKSSKYGFGFEHSLTKEINRLKILLLIEQIASLVAWIVGYYVEVSNEASRFCNGSTKKKRRLSLINLGLRGIKYKIPIPRQVWKDCFLDGADSYAQTP